MRSDPGGELLPEYLPISPLTLRCPFCGAKPGEDCETASRVQLEVVHIARMKAAAKMDKAARATPENLV